MGVTPVGFQVRRDDLATTRVVPSDLRAPVAGEVLVEIERFGFSANNVTYGLLGSQLRYWDLFPAQDGWGRIPVWGYLRVVASEAPGIEVGRRGYGLCPMSTHVLLRPDRVRPGGFVDQSGSRSQLSAIYNAYSWLDMDPAHQSELEDQLLVLRPVFWLSFLVDDYLVEQDLLRPGGVLLTSASSRAAIGIAHLLSQRGVHTVGLTSPGHRAFVEGLKVYNEVHSYEEHESRGPASTVLVDVAGNPALRDRIGRRYGEALTHTVIAGFTHRDASNVDGPRTADRTVSLTVPMRLVERARQIGWPQLNRGYAAQLARFTAFAHDWLRVDHGRGADRVEEVYRRVLNNTAASSDAHVLSLASG
jgi:hypothetical protein